MGFYENQNKNNMNKGTEQSAEQVQQMKGNNKRKQLNRLELKKLQENNKWVIIEDERRWTYVVDDPWNVHAT